MVDLRLLIDALPHLYGRFQGFNYLYLTEADHDALQALADQHGQGERSADQQ